MSAAVRVHLTCVKLCVVSLFILGTDKQLAEASREAEKASCVEGPQGKDA